MHPLSGSRKRPRMQKVLPAVRIAWTGIRSEIAVLRGRHRFDLVLASPFSPNEDLECFRVLQRLPPAGQSYFGALTTLIWFGGCRRRDIWLSSRRDGHED